MPAFPQPEGEPEYPEIAYKNKELPSEYTLPKKAGDIKVSQFPLFDGRALNKPDANDCAFLAFAMRLSDLCLEHHLAQIW
jgi:hypothetical protein